MIDIAQCTACAARAGREMSIYPLRRKVLVGVPSDAERLDVECEQSPRIVRYSCGASQNKKKSIWKVDLGPRTVIVSTNGQIH